MKFVIVLAILAMASCDWQDGYIDESLWHSTRDMEYYDMVDPNPDELSTLYGALSVGVRQPFVKYDDSYSDYPLDLKRQNRGRRWRVRMDGVYLVSTSTNPTTKGAASDFLSSEVMYCMACFDVKKAEEELKEGHKGIGACMQRIGTKVYNDANFFGSIEAQGSDAFRFNEDSKNDWDTDSGYLGDTSNIYYDWDVGGDAVKDIYYLTAEFVSEPLDVNANSPKNLGI